MLALPREWTARCRTCFGPFESAEAARGASSLCPECRESEGAEGTALHPRRCRICEKAFKLESGQNSRRRICTRCEGRIVWRGAGEP